MKIFLARHATPQWMRPEPAYQSMPGPRLNHQGEVEARSLGEFLKVEGIQRVYTSPLERCQQTAWIVARISGAAVEVQPGLAEIHPGEHYESVRQRILPVFEAACRESALSGPHALVTHGGPIAILLRELGLGRNEIQRKYNFDHGNPLPPAGAWLVERLGNDKPWSLALIFTPQAMARKEKQLRNESTPFI
jgi:broad specificity phosphatase PhoE